MVDIKILLSIEDFNSLGDVPLLDLVKHSKIEDYSKEDKLIAKDLADVILYLLSGQMELAGLGATSIIEENSLRVQEPIFRIHTPGYYGRCTEPCTVLHIDKNIYDKYVAPKDVPEAGIYLETVKMDHKDQSENSFIEEVQQRFAGKSFNLPTLPEIALHINKAVDDENVGAAKLASIIQYDPAITGRIIQVANSALFGPGPRIESLPEAITRIGLQSVRSIVVSVVLRDLFRPESALIKTYMKRYYEHSIRIGVICYFLAKYCKGLNADHGFLAGLLHDIGVIPLLVVADQHAELSQQTENLDAVLIELKGTVGGILLRQWGFSPAYALTAEQVYDWDRAPSSSPDYCDLVQVALIHSGLVGGENIDGPLLCELPAFKRLNLDTANPADDIRVLKEMSKRISEMINILCK